MATHAQTQRATSKGMSEALLRGKDRQETALILHHIFDAQRLPILLRQLQNMMPMGVSLVLAPMSATAADLAKSEAHITTLVNEKRDMVEKMAAMQAQIDGLRGASDEMVIDGVKWMSLKAATKIIHRSYATLWRAQDDGRLKTINIGGNVRNQMLCDPSTYQAKVGR
jgi:hypothetical protein